MWRQSSLDLRKVPRPQLSPCRLDLVPTHPGPVRGNLVRTGVFLFHVGNETSGAGRVSSFAKYEKNANKNRSRHILGPVARVLRGASARIGGLSYRFGSVGARVEASDEGVLFVWNVKRLDRKSAMSKRLARTP